MEAEKIKRLNEFLRIHKTSCDDLSKSKVQQLLKADDAIQIRLSQIKHAEEFLKQPNINILNIASDTNISRKTFYNNELLRLYVEHCAAKVCDFRTESKEQKDELQNKVADLESQVRKFLIRDIETENLRKELETTQRELSHSLIAYDELQCKYEKLLRKKEELPQKPRCKILIPKDGKLGPYFRG